MKKLHTKWRLFQLFQKLKIDFRSSQVDLNSIKGHSEALWEPEVFIERRDLSFESVLLEFDIHVRKTSRHTFPQSRRHFDELEFHFFALFTLKLNFYKTSWPSFNVVFRVFLLPCFQKLVHHMLNQPDANFRLPEKEIFEEVG